MAAEGESARPVLPRRKKHSPSDRRVLPDLPGDGADPAVRAQLGMAVGAWRGADPGGRAADQKIGGDRIGDARDLREGPKRTAGPSQIIPAGKERNKMTAFSALKNRRRLYLPAALRYIMFSGDALPHILAFRKSTARAISAVGSSPTSRSMVKKPWKPSSSRAFRYLSHGTLPWPKGSSR